MTVALGTPVEREALEAWRQLSPGAPEPVRAVVLKQKKRGKGSVHRLVGSGPGGGDVVAKRSLARRAAVESELYERVLPSLSVRTAAFYGAVPELDSDHCWLFFEYVRGEPVASIGDPRAAEWLAGLHTAASAGPRPEAIPGKGLAYYLEIVRVTRREIVVSLDRDGYEPAERSWLTATLEELEYLESFWSDLAELCEGLPETLVHGDLDAKNLIVGLDGQLVAVDWEGAGWGRPATDLRDVDAGRYHAAVAVHWPGSSLLAVEDGAGAGHVLDVIGRMRGMSSALPEGPVVRSLRNRRRQLAEALGAAGWG